MDIVGIIKALFNSPILYFVSLIVVLLLVFTGKIKVHSKVLSIGNESDKERSIIRNQMDFAKAFCLSLKNDIKDDNIYRKTCVIEQIFDQLLSMIALNHITMDEEYIMVKQAAIYYTASTYCEEDCYKTDEFKQLIYEKTKTLIYDLVRIRNLKRSRK